MSDNIVLIICFEFMYCIVDGSPNTQLLDDVHHHLKKTNKKKTTVKSKDLMGHVNP